MAVGVSVATGVAVGGPGVLVAVGVAADAQLARTDCGVPSGFVNVAVRLDPAGPTADTLLGPVSENASLQGRPT